MKTARYIKNAEGFKGDAKIYELSEPVSYGDDALTSHVVVSAVNVFGLGDETYIFPCDENGEVLSWLELEGSRKGTLDHEYVLNNQGYEVI